MTAVAARELRDGEVVFVGIGLPNLACNLARATHAPSLVLIYESGAVGAVPARLPMSIGDPALVTGALMVCGMADIFQFFLQNGRIEVGLPGRRAGGPLRQHQHDGGRRLREAQSAAPGERRRGGDRRARAAHARDRARVEARVPGGRGFHHESRPAHARPFAPRARDARRRSREDHHRPRHPRSERGHRRDGARRALSRRVG